LLVAYTIVLMMHGLTNVKIVRTCIANWGDKKEKDPRFWLET